MRGARCEIVHELALLSIRRFVVQTSKRTSSMGDYSGGA
jgi:hypothetical protein